MRGGGPCCEVSAASRCTVFEGAAEWTRGVLEVQYVGGGGCREVSGIWQLASNKSNKILSFIKRGPS